MNKRLAKLKNIQEANINLLNRNSKETLIEEKNYIDPIIDEPDDSEQDDFETFFGFGVNDEHPDIENDEEEESYDPGDRDNHYKSHSDYSTEP
jgi:hypothetical protein